MAIDIEAEKIISFPEVIARLPRRRKGKSVHLSCVYRWSSKGFKGTVLETIQVGASRCTTVEALTRFLNAISAPSSNSTSQQSRSLRQRQSASRDAINELSRRGM